MQIDKELLNMSSEHIFIKNIPSIVKDKNTYPCGECYNITELLFTNESSIWYIPNLSNYYNSFHDLLSNHVVYYNMFEDYQKSEIDYLINHNIIMLDNDNRIILHRKKAKILLQLYEHDVLCSNYVKAYQDVIEDFERAGIIYFKSSLFSRPEQDYYNYMMNKSEFDNGLDLRNHYLHGTQIDDENQNKLDYFDLLRIMILIVLKINEEFCIYYPVNQ